MLLALPSWQSLRCPLARTLLLVAVTWALAAPAVAQNSLTGPAPADAVTAMPRPEQVVQTRVVWRRPDPGNGSHVALAVILNITKPFHINPDKPQIPPHLSNLIPTALTVKDAPPGTHVGTVQYPAAHAVEVRYTGEPEQVPAWEGRTVLFVPVRVDDVAALPASLFLSLRYQACNDRQCLFPVTIAVPADLSDAGQAAGEDVRLFANYRADEAFPAGGTASDIPPATTTALPPAAPSPTAGPWFVAALVAQALLGGFLLNLTPCVLPVIPIKMMSLAHGAGSRSRTLVLGAVMSLGVVAFWLGLAAAMTLITDFTATNQLFQKPLFSLSVGVLIAVMAVGMCGLFSLQLPASVYAMSPRQDTLGGSFGLGIMTAVLSTPCTAPFMGAAIGVSLTLPRSLLILVFAAIGIGMAIPYLVLAVFPQLAGRVPRAGEAGDLLKQVMGLCMLAAATFFIGVGLSGLLISDDGKASTAYWWAVMTVLAVAGAWLAWRTPRVTAAPLPRGVFIALGVLVLAASPLLGYWLTRPGDIPWVYYTPQRFESAQRQGRVVVLEFTAEWCLNCKALERTVLNQSRVVQALNATGVTPIKVDLTGNNEAGNARLAAMGRASIPLLVVLAPDGREVFKSDFYTVDQVVSAVQQARDLAAAAASPP